MIEIECAQRIFYVPENNEEAFKLLQYTNTAGQKYTKNKLFKDDRVLGREGSFCYRNGTLKLESYYMNDGNLQDIKISEGGLDVIAKSSSLKEPPSFEKYGVTNILEGKVNGWDCFLAGLFNRFSNLK